MKEHEDFISDMILAEDGRTLLCAGGDGYLSVWNRKSGAPSLHRSRACTPRAEIMRNASADTPLRAAARSPGKLLAMSDQMEDELLSISIVKRGAKVPASSAAGADSQPHIGPR